MTEAMAAAVVQEPAPRARPETERARPKIKSKVVSDTLANADVLDMFHGVIGSSGGSSTTSVTHPKYLRMKRHTERFLIALDVLYKSGLMEMFPADRDELWVYLEALRKQFAEAFCAPDFSLWLGPPVSDEFASATDTAPYFPDDYNKVPPEVLEVFKTVFTNVKNCSLVNTIIVTCKNLTAHKKSLENPEALKDRFLLKAGSLYRPLPDLSLNFKQLYIDDRLGPNDRAFILAVLHKMYVIGHDLYKAVTAPDIDVSEFVGVIMGSVDKVRGKIPRCDEAFNKIVESVDLLKNNFGDYYKDYAASGNTSIIMENFVLDVSKTSNTSPKVTAQFRKIITHYRKMSQQQPANSKLKSLFNQVDANFAELEKKNKAADEAPVSDEESADDAATKPGIVVASVVRNLESGARSVMMQDSGAGGWHPITDMIDGVNIDCTAAADEGGLAEELDGQQ